MASIIREMYRGTLFPSEDRLPSSREYQEIRQAYSQSHDCLHKKLLVISRDLDHEWQRSQETCIQMCAMESEEYFISGFRMGAALMMEVFFDAEEDD